MLKKILISLKVAFHNPVFLTLLAGILFRLPFLPVKGFEQDFLFFASIAKSLLNGFTVCYDNVKEIEGGILNYPPVYLYILKILAHGYRLFTDAPFSSTGFLILLKCATICFEIAVSLVIYRWTARQWGHKSGLTAMGFYFLNPALIYVSVVFGQVDAIFSALLLFSLLSIIENRAFWGGFFLAASLLMKIMTLPFIPFFFLIYPWKREYKQTSLMVLGFLAGGLLILSPFLCTGRILLVYQRCFETSVNWRTDLTIGALNLWAFHADPLTHDGRIWGWLYDSDGQCRYHWFLSFFTYKKLGTGLFGLAYLLCFSDLKTRKEKVDWLIPAAHIALAFFLFPTRMHERYLYPFFAFAAILSPTSTFRKVLYISFSLVFLDNMMRVCPLIGAIPPLASVYQSWSLWIAASLLLLYCLFLGYEYAGNFLPNQTRFVIIATSLGMGIFIITGLAYLRWITIQPDIKLIYLSSLKPIQIQQDWPQLPPDKILIKDRTVNRTADGNEAGNELRINGILYRHGIGTHAKSRIEYEVPGTHNLFESYIGVDEEIRPAAEKNPGVGTVAFSVLVNGEKRYESPLMLVSSPAKYIAIRLPEGKKTNKITLIVNDAGDGSNSDHADWALARVRLTHPK